ncbi:hypothetical protein CDEST_12008 [Colletotrichum destructivum]|uniref:Uncharacterized protein n=1 Tax=Colletotrichum destructivum TaxID=34406 RepID=A0AAX4IUP5_9PEZI|nr:hypothetical protein CDEST_12008 [Colletotrichum destructivum]
MAGIVSFDAVSMQVRQGIAEAAVTDAGGFALDTASKRLWRGKENRPRCHRYKAVDPHDKGIFMFCNSMGPGRLSPTKGLNNPGKVFPKCNVLLPSSTCRCQSRVSLLLCSRE